MMSSILCAALCTSCLAMSPDMPTMDAIEAMTDEEQSAFLDALEKFFVHVAKDKRAWAKSIGTGLPYQKTLHQVAKKTRIPPALLLGFVRGESGGDPGAVSRAGALGLMQLMPTTGARYGLYRRKDFFQPDKSLRAGATHLRDLLNDYTDGCWSCAAMAYNFGPRNLERSLRAQRFASAAVWYAGWIAHKTLAVLAESEFGKDARRSVTSPGPLSSHG